MYVKDRLFQSQTRRLLPRNVVDAASDVLFHVVSIADATLASSQPVSCVGRNDGALRVSIADATLASSQLNDRLHSRNGKQVSIADATLASSQRLVLGFVSGLVVCFNRRRDACFLATLVTIRSHRP